MRNSIVLKGLLAATAAVVPLLCNAESNVQTGANTAAPGATAHVDFRSRFRRYCIFASVPDPPTPLGS